MNLDPLQLLRSASMGMYDGSMLGPREGYEQASSIVVGLALSIMADQLEHAAANLTEENDAMRGIFREALAAQELCADALRPRLAAAVASADTSLVVSGLRASNDSLRDLLGDLLASIEENDAAPARSLEQLIWDELNCSTQRRKVGIAPF